MTDYKKDPVWSVVIKKTKTQERKVFVQNVTINEASPIVTRLVQAGIPCNIVVTLQNWGGGNVTVTFRNKK